MEIKLVPHALFTLFTAFLTAAIAVIAWRRKGVPGSRIFSWYMIAVTEWNLAASAESIVVGQFAKILFSQIVYVGLVCVAPLSFFFILSYTRQLEKLSRKVIALIWVIPVVTLILVWTNAWHGWVWSGFSPGSIEANILVYHHGIWFWIHVTFIYFLTLVAYLIFLRAFIQTHSIYRLQIGMMMLGSLFPLITGIMYIFGLNPVPGMDISMMGFTATGLIVAWSIFRLKLLELVPIAREMLIDEIEDSILVLDTQNHIIDANPTAIKIIGFPSKAIIGQPLSVLCAKYPVFEILYSDKNDVEVEILGDNKQFWFLKVHYHLLRNHYGDSIGRLVVLHDISALKRAEEQNAKLYQSANRRARELDALHAITVELLSEFDLKKLLNAIVKRSMRLFGAGLGAISLYDPIHKDFEIVVSHGMVRDYGGDRIAFGDGLMGTVAETRKPLIVDDYAAWEKRSPRYPELGIYTLLGVPLQVGQECLGVIMIGFEKTKGKFNQTGQDLLTMFAQQASLAIRNAQLVSQLEQFATTDMLTGICNRRHFFELAEKEFDRAVRYHIQLTIIMADLDHFKNVNDTYGHSVGDQVLHAVAQMITQLLRKIDIIGRIGGEEFAILLPETSLDEGRQVAERICQLIERNDNPSFKSPVKITISLGVAALDNRQKSFETLLDSADKALYAAKQAGRNQVKIYR